MNFLFFLANIPRSLRNGPFFLPMNASDIFVENEKPKITPFPIGRPEILGERLFRLENDEKRRGRKLVGGGGRFREAINSCVFCVCVCVWKGVSID